MICEGYATLVFVIIMKRVGGNKGGLDWKITLKIIHVSEGENIININHNCDTCNMRVLNYNLCTCIYIYRMS